MFSAKNKLEMIDSYQMIKENIEIQGFEKALLYSIAESADTGGKIGWINENSPTKKY